MYEKNTRVSGGSSYSDALFRISATSQNYARKMFQKVMEKNSFDPKEIQYIATEDFFLLTLGQKPAIIEDFHFVELKRCEGVHAFEEWLVKTIREMIK